MKHAGDQSPKAEAEILMNEGLVFARKMLKEYGEFLPFGVAMTTNGEIVHVGATTGNERSPSREILAVLLSGYRKQAIVGTHRAIAAFVDVMIEPPGCHGKTDAIQICLEHRDGFFADVFLPYRLEEGSLSFAAMFAQKRTPCVFVRDD